MWRNELIEFANKFEHPAWGFNHSTRVYEMSLLLGEKEGVNMDQDALFVAAYLHDMGAFTPYKKINTDHSDTSAEKCEELLNSIGFPNEKVKLVQEIIKTHMYYAIPTNQIESLIFHDADTLDFMGIIGITRILSIIGIDDWTPDLNSAIKLIRNFQKTLPKKLITKTGKEMGQKRAKEMADFLILLSEQTADYNYL